MKVCWKSPSDRHQIVGSPGNKCAHQRCTTCSNTSQFARERVHHPPEVLPGTLRIEHKQNSFSAESLIARKCLCFSKIFAHTKDTKKTTTPKRVFLVCTSPPLNAARKTTDTFHETVTKYHIKRRSKTKLPVCPFSCSLL